MSRLPLVLALGLVTSLACCTAPSLPPVPLAELEPLYSAPPLPPEQRARSVIAAHGYADIGPLARIGDYWQAPARWHGSKVTVYLLDDGEVLHEPPVIGAP